MDSKPKDPPVILYCIYARKSMEAEERQAISIDSQLNEMKIIVERDGLTVVATRTESHSAKNSGEREIFNEMITDIKKGKYNTILTWNPDRLSRNAGDLGQLVDLMDKGLLHEIRTFTQLFTNSPNDKFLLMILCSQAKFENDNKVINVKRGLRARAEMGLMPSSTPIGYLTSKLRDRPCYKEIDKERAPIIKQMYEKVAHEKYSIYAVWRWLRSIEFRSPGGNLLSPSTVQNILKRSFYTGNFEYPKGSDKWYKGTHTPIITQQLFDDANRALARNEWRIGRRKPKSWPFAFLHMMRCGRCGSGVTAQEKQKIYKTKGKTVLYRYYTCTRGRDRACHEPYINEKQLMSELHNIIGQVDINLIGMRDYLEQNIERYHGYNSFITDIPKPERSQERKEYELRKYAQVIFENGSIEEQREILKYLTSRLILKDRKIYIDNAS